MSTTSPSEVLQLLQWRYSTKRFDPGRRIPDDVWAALEQALVLSPSSFGLQPWKFVIVEDPAVRQQLSALSWGQPQVADAHRYVVFAGLRTTTVEDVDRYLQHYCLVRGTAIETLQRYRSVLVDFVTTGWAAADPAAWNARQVYLALGQFMTAAAMLGVDTSALEGIDMNGYDRVLGLADSRYTTLCACAAGYRLDGDRFADAPKVRFPADQVIERR